MDAFAEAQEAATSDVLSIAWDRALAGWQEQALHDELLRLVSQHDAYAWAAARYRDFLRSHPKDEIAQRQIDRLARAAEVTLLATAAARPEQKSSAYRATIAILVLLILALIGGMLYAGFKRAQARPGEVPPANTSTTIVP